MRRVTSLRRRARWVGAAVIALTLILPAAAMAARPKADEEGGVADEVISLPLRELGIVIDREGKGVYLPYAELLNLWQLARQKSGEVEPTPPATHVIRSAHLDGTLEDEAIAVTATFEIELLTDEWTAVELGLSGIAISHALDGDGPLAVHEGLAGPKAHSSRLPVPTGAVAELRGKGTHTITVQGLVRLEEKGTRFAFTMPRAALSLVELSIPSGRKLEIAGAVLASSTVADNVTRHAFLLGNAPMVSGTLSAADEEPRAPGVLYVRTDTVVGFGQDVVETATRITATVRHRPIETISVLVPESVKVASVTGEAVSHWTVLPADGGEQRVAIRLARRVVDRAAVELRTEAFYEQTDTALDVPIPVIEDATDTRGVVGVGRAPVADVFVASTDGMVPAGKSELALGRGSVDAVYRFRRQPARMTLGLDWPVQRFRVSDTTLLDIQRDVLRLNAVLTIAPSEGAIFDLDVVLPPHYEILNVTAAVGGAGRQNTARTSSELKVGWDVEEPEDPAGERLLHVRLPHKVEPPQALVLVINARKMPQADLTSGAPDARVSEPLGGFVVRGAERQTGIIGIAADPSYLVEDEATSGLVPAPIEALNAAGLAGAGLRFGYTYREPAFAATLVISRKRPLVNAATATTVAVHGDVIDVLALTEFSIWYSTLNEILLRLPASVDPVNVEITGDDIRDRHLLTPDEVRALGEEAGAHIWRITLDVGKTGLYVLSAAYQVKIAGGETTHWIPLPDYGPMPELEADRGFVAVIANREIELATEIGDVHLREMDKADLPTRLFPSTPVARVLFAYQYPKPPDAEKALGLVVKRHDPASVLPALVEAAEVVVCVSRQDGAFAEARYTVLNNEEAALRMRLPAACVLWGVLVDGTEIKAREQTDKHGTVYVIPIKATASPRESQQVVVRYWSAMPKLKRGGGTYTVRLPAFDNLHVGRARLTIYQPDDYRFIRFGGTMNLKAEVRRVPLLVRWLAASDEALQMPVFAELARARIWKVPKEKAELPTYDEADYDEAAETGEEEEAKPAVTDRDELVPAEALAAEVFRLSRGRTQTVNGRVFTVDEWLKRSGALTWPHGSSMVYDAPTNTLTVTAVPSDMRLVQRLLAAWDAGRAGQYLGKELPATTTEGETLVIGDTGGFVQALPPGAQAKTAERFRTGLVRGLLSLNIEVPAEGVEMPFDRLSGGGEVVVRYASSNGMGRAQTIVIVLTLLIAYWLRKLIRWSRTGLVLFLAAVCTIGPGLSNYWMTPYWDMVTKGVLLLIPVFVIDYVVMRVGRRRLATAAAALLLVALAAPGAIASRPSEPAAVIEQGGKRLYIPFTQVDRAKLADEVGVFVPLDEFIRLWERAHPETVMAKAPREYVLTNAVYRGRIGQGGVAFTASFDVAVLNDAWTAVALPFDRIAIEKATLDGAEAPLTMLNGAPTLVFEKAGHYKLELDFAQPIAGVLEQGSVRLAMPPAQAALLEIEAPVEQLEFRTDAARPGVTVAGPGSTLYRMPVGGLTRVFVSWRQKGVTRTVGRAIFHHDATMRLYVDERLILGELSSKVTLVRGQLEGLTYEVPADATILNVAGQGVADWRLVKTEDGSVLAVEFSQPVTRGVQLVIEVALEYPGLDKPIAFPDVRLRDAQSERGSIELNARHGLDLVITDSSGLEPKLKPPSTRTLTETGLTYEPRVARAYPRRPFSLVFEARRIPDDWAGVVQTLYTVQEPRVLLESHIQLIPESGSMFELHVEVPAGFDVIEISGPQVADWRITDSDKNIAAVQLRDEQTGAFEVRLVAERLHDEMPSALELGVPRVLNVARGHGIVAVAFDPAWQIVEPRHGQGMHATRVRATPSWMRRAGGVEVRFAASYWDVAAPTIAFGLQQTETQLSATLAHHLRVFTDEVTLRVLVAYSVDGKPVRELKFTAPAALRDGLRVVGLELRGPARRTGQTPDGRDIWTVQFHSPVDGLGAFEVRWSGEIPASRELDVPRIGAVDAAVQTVFVTVENLSANEVTATAWPGLAKLPVEQVPVVPPDARLASIALAYRAVEPEWALALNIASYEIAHLIPAHIISAKFETVVDHEGGARTRMTLKVRNRTQQFLRVTFPEPIELWALSVGGEPAQPSRAAGNTYLLPLIKSGLADLPFDVVVTYSHRIGGPKRRVGRRLAWSGGFTLRAPEIEGLPTNRTVWELWLPSGYRTLEFGGNMEQIEVARSLAEELEDVAKEYEQQRAIAERTKGKAQQKALGNLQQIEKSYRDLSTLVSQEYRLNEALLEKDDKAIRKARNVGRGTLARQQTLSERTLESASRTFTTNWERAQSIAVQAEREQQAEQQVEGGTQYIVNMDALSNWGTNTRSGDDLKSKEIERAKQQQEQKPANEPEQLEARQVLGDRSVLKSVQRDFESDADSNAGFFYTTDAREVQRRVGGLQAEQPQEPTTMWATPTTDVLEKIGGQLGYTAHKTRVTTEAIRPEARSLAFDIPREGRLFVFGKVNAEAEIEVRQLRASTWHAFKTVGAFILLALVAWAIQRARIAERVRRRFEGRQAFGVLVGLTALLAVVVLIGRFRYAVMNLVLVIAAVVWASLWIVHRRARARKRALVEGPTEDETQE